jgi:hypothetical protein
MSFDPRSMRQVFDAGRQFGQQEGPWMESPPGIDPSDWKIPRVGVSFTQRRAKSSSGVPAPQGSLPPISPLKAGKHLVTP